MGLFGAETSCIARPVRRPCLPLLFGKGGEMNYRNLRTGEKWRNGDMRRWGTGIGRWENIPVYLIGALVGGMWTKHNDARRPITLGKRQTQATNKRSLKRAKPRIKRVR